MGTVGLLLTHINRCVNISSGVVESPKEATCLTTPILGVRRSFWPTWNRASPRR